MKERIYIYLYIYIKAIDRERVGRRKEIRPRERREMWWIMRQAAMKGRG